MVAWIKYLRTHTLMSDFKLWFYVSAGQSGLGKSTLVNTLFKSKISPKSCTPNYGEKISKTVKLHSVSHGESASTHTHVHALNTRPGS